MDQDRKINLRRRFTTALWAVSLVALGLFGLSQLGSVRIGSEAGSILSGDNRNQASYGKVMRILNQDVVIVLTVETDVFSEEGMALVGEISQALYQQDGIVDVKSFTHSVKPVRQGFRFQMDPLVGPDPSAEDLAALKAFSLSNPLIKNVMVAEDGRNAVILSTYRVNLRSLKAKEHFEQTLMDILRPFQQRGVDVSPIGLPLIENEIRSTLRNDLKLLAPGALLLACLILVISFRSWTLAFSALALHGVLLATLPLLLKWVNHDLTVFSILLLPLISATHLAMLTHWLTAVRREMTSQVPIRVLLAEATRETRRPALFASLTTAVGLLGLGLSDSSLVQNFGFLGACAVAFAWCLTYGPGRYFIDAILSVLDRLRLKATTVAPRLEMDSWHVSGLLNAKATAAISIAALVLGAIGIASIRTDVRAVEFLSPESPIRETVELFDQRYGGINVFQLSLDTKRHNGINDPEFLRFLEKVETFGLEQDGVSAVYSYSQLLSMMNQVWNGGTAEAYALPTNSMLLSVFTIALKAQNLPFLTALTDEDFRISHLIVRTKDMPSKAYLETIEAIADFAEREKPENLQILQKSGIQDILRADRELLKSQRESVGYTLGLIVLCLTFLWKSPRLALIAVMASLMPIVLSLAVAGFLKIPLNSVTVMVAAIAFGIGIDDNVHFITHWRTAISGGASVRSAIELAFKAKRRSIISSSIMLIGVFTLLCFMNFPPVQHFGFLTALALVFTTLSALFLLPPWLLKMAMESESL